MPLRLLFIDDDDTLAAAVVSQLEERGHQVDRAGTASGGHRLIAAGIYDVIIVDRMLPDSDGLKIVQDLRACEDMTPVLVLTAMSGITDRVVGLRSGADDYLLKPCSFDEMEARVEALARRASAVTSRLVIGDLVLDRLARTVHRGSTRITLMPREFRLLELLMLNSPSVLTRSMMLEDVWEIRFDPGTNLVESHISRLRSKIDRGGDPPLIHTVRGEGYVALAG